MRGGKRPRRRLHGTSTICWVGPSSASARCEPDTISLEQAKKWITRRRLDNRIKPSRGEPDVRIAPAGASDRSPTRAEGTCCHAEAGSRPLAGRRAFPKAPLTPPHAGQYVAAKIAVEWTERMKCDMKFKSKFLIIGGTVVLSAWSTLS